MEPQILARWLAGNADLLSRSVRVAVLDAEGTAPTLGGLVFQLGELLLPTPDGALFAKDLEPWASPTLASLAQALQPDLRSAANTADKILQARGTTKVAETVRATPHGQVVQLHLSQARELLESNAKLLDAVTGASSELAKAEATAIRRYLKEKWAPFETAHAQWRSNNPDGKAMGEAMLESAIEDWDKGSHLSALATAFGWGVANMFSGDSLQTSLKSHTAYRKGEVSFDHMSEFTQAVETRGKIVGGITAVLTVASFGLGGLLARTTSAGGSVFVMGGYGAVAGAAPLAAGRIYTDLTPLNDPGAQASWTASRPSWGSVALGGALGFAMGGAFGYASWLSRSGPQLQALAVASETGAPALPPPGAQAQVLRPGTVKVTMDGLPGHMEITRSGWRHFAPTGESGKLVAVAEASWALESGVAGRTPWAVLEAPSIGNPAAIGVTRQGWALHAPGRPLQQGLWDDFLLGSGPRQHGLVPSNPLAIRSPLFVSPLGPRLGSPSPYSFGGSTLGKGLPAGFVPPTLTTPMAPNLLRSAYAAELLQRPDLLLHLDSIVARSQSGSAVLGPPPATQSLQLEQVLVAIRQGASPQIIETMVANIHNPMFSQGPGMGLTRCTTNCGYVSISHGLKIQSPAQFQLPETLYQSTKAALSPSDPLPRTLLFPLKPTQSTAPTLGLRGLQSMDQYTLDSVASARGLRLEMADLQTALRPTFHHQTQARMIHKQIDAKPKWKGEFEQVDIATALTELRRSGPSAISDENLATLVPELLPKVSTPRPGLAGHYIVGFKKSGSMGHFMTVEVKANGQIIAYENQIGRFFSSWLDLGSTYGSLPNFSRRIVTP